MWHASAAPREQFSVENQKRFGAGLTGMRGKWLNVADVDTTLVGTFPAMTGAFMA